MSVRREAWNDQFIIADTETESNFIDVQEASFGGLFADGDFSGTEVTYLLRFTEDGDDFTADATITTDLADNGYNAINASVFGARYIALVSDVAQTGDSTITVVLKG